MDQEITAKFLADISDFQSKMAALQASASDAEAATASLGSGAQSAAGGLSQVGSASAGSSEAADAAVSSFLGLSESTEVTAESTKKAGGAAKETGPSINELANNVQQSIQNWQQLAMMVAQFAMAIGQAHDAVVATSLAFDYLTKSEDDANRMLSDLHDSAAAMDFGTKAIDDAAQHFLMLGYNAETTKKEIAEVADAIAAMGGTSKQIVPVLDELHKVQGETKVTTQDMDMLAKNGIASWQSLADGMGVSIDEAKRRVKDGAVSGKEAYKDMMLGMMQYQGAAQQQSASFSSELTQMGDKGGKTFSSLAEELTKFLHSVNQLIDAVNKLSESFDNLMNGPAGGILKAIGQGIGSIIDPLGPLGAMMGHAEGGTNLPGGWRVVGEQGPELQYSPGGDTIIPNGADPTSFLGGGSGMSALSSIGPLVIQIHPQPVMLDSRVVAEATFQHFSPMIRQVTGRRQ